MKIIYISNTIMIQFNFPAEPHREGSVLPRSLDIAGFASQDKYVVKCDAICVIDARGGKETARGHSKEYSQAA